MTESVTSTACQPGQGLGWRDGDGDGYGGPGEAPGCVDLGQLATRNNDCDDDDLSVHPGEIESCDGRDQNCDGQIDEGLAVTTWYGDGDGDGHGAPHSGRSDCAPISGEVAEGGDCDDDDLSVHPDALETCDGRDQNCDGQIDEGLAISTWYADADGDGHGAPDSGRSDCAPMAGEVAEGGDCHDDDLSVHPDALETCDGRDQDCDGQIDEGLVISTWYADADGDGHGAPDGGSSGCAPMAGEVPVGDDCDDNAAARHPGAAETDCTDPTDYNCDGSTGYLDDDGDGWAACSECDDLSAASYPGAEERCDGADNNCDGDVDESLDLSTWYADEDGDGVGSVARIGCAALPGEVMVGGDCDDGEAAVGPNVAERCNQIDDDCDGSVDEDDATDSIVWYADGDNDGFGAGEGVSRCQAALGEVSAAGDCADDDAQRYPGAAEPDCADPVDYDCDGTSVYADEDGDGAAACVDCDDSNVNRHPDAEERCDGLDNDCDGEQDEEPTIDGQLWYADLDGDGLGDPSVARIGCAPEPFEVVRDGDCDDLNADVHPGAAERCDGVDEDCDGERDEDAIDAALWYADTDRDGYGSGPGQAACSVTGDVVTNSADCDDRDPEVHPGSQERCDRADNDCDGEIDEDDANDPRRWFIDGDGDGFGVGAPEFQCEAPAGWVGQEGDCEDNDATISPSQPERCDGFDDDCDGEIDEDDAIDAGIWYRDADGDGRGDPNQPLSGCTQPDGAVRQGDDNNDDPNRPVCVEGDARSSGTIEAHGHLYDTTTQVGVPGAAVWLCGGGAATVTDSNGDWTLTVPDSEWVTIDQSAPGYVTNRVVFDPMVEGPEDWPVSVGLPPDGGGGSGGEGGDGGGDSSGDGGGESDHPMAALGLLPRDGLAWVDVDALDRDTYFDLPYATLDLTVPYDGAVGYTDEGVMILSNQTSIGYDVIFANVALAPLRVVASHPERSVCDVPPEIEPESGYQLLLSVYCY